MKLEINNISKRFLKKASYFGKAFSEVTAVSDVSMHLDAGKIYGLVGESGCGKSTLAKIIVGLEKADTGSIKLNDLIVWSGPHNRYEYNGFQMVFQNPYASLNPRWKIHDILTEGFVRRSISKADSEDRIKAVLAEVNIPYSYCLKYPYQMSGGERQRIALARVLLADPTVLILDEPVSSLDLTIQSSILDLITNVAQQRQMVILYISHDLRTIEKIADYVYVMYNGSLVEEGAKDKLFSAPEHEYTKLLLGSLLCT